MSDRTRHGRREFVLRLGALGAVGASFGLLGCDEASERLGALLAPETVFPPTPPDASHIDDIAHALNRLTWGPRPGDRTRIAEMGLDAFIDEQLEPESIDDRRCEWRIAEIESLHLPRAELYEVPPPRLALDLTRARLIRALRSRRQLFERMVEIWTDHFNIGFAKGESRWMKIADDRETIRPHAMGAFRDLVRASLTSPAMLISLDGLDNRVVHPDDRPNENHARELLELHTLGLEPDGSGVYTQRDVMETARCLSGWTFTHDWRRFFTARVAFDPSRHDGGEKEILGVRIPAGGGADDIERLLDILCPHPSTARHVARRLCRTFVSETPTEETVAAIAEAFLHHDGQIRPTLRAVFATEECIVSRGNLLKRPTEFTISALRALDARSDCGPAIVEHLERMGHAPFQHPTPDGYPTESAPWLASLLWRWTLAGELVGNALPATRVDMPALRERFGGHDGLVAHLLGRVPTDVERDAIGDDDASIALALASPAFQFR